MFLSSPIFVFSSNFKTVNKQQCCIKIVDDWIVGASTLPTVTQQLWRNNCDATTVTQQLQECFSNIVQKPLQI